MSITETAQEMGASLPMAFVPEVSIPHEETPGLMWRGRTRARRH
jgi:hypothetical protein